jgi:hypothetical protein
MTTALLLRRRAAVAAAARGWRVFPLRPNDKRPAVRDWETRATTDLNRIHHCWAAGQWNIGIVCGPSGLVVIDLDTPKPGDTAPPAWQLAGVTCGGDGAALVPLRGRLGDWIREHGDQLEHAEPAMPVEDRAADTWEPLVVVADLAGAHWPDQARAAAVSLAGGDDPGEASLRLRLLTDCRAAFGDGQARSTTVLLDRLKADAEAPWASYGVHGLSAVKLGAPLREYDIRSANIRFGDGTQAKGYQRADLLDAWTRYCPPAVPAPYPSQPSRPSATRNGTPGTAPPATCIQCRQPLAYDDGTHTHPTCDRPSPIRATREGDR